MKYCKKCGVLYTTDVCPKCGIEEPDQNPIADESDPKTVKRQWIGLLIAIPAAILIIMGAITFYFKIIH